MSDTSPVYREIVPPPSLARFVRVMWMLDLPAGSGEPETIVPDGCPEIVLNFGDPVTHIADDGRRERHPQRLLVGQTTRGTVIEPAGRVALAGVRFHPWAASAFIGLAASELIDALVPTDAAVPRRLRVAIDSIYEEMRPGAVLESLAHALDRYARRLDAPDALARAIAQSMATSTGVATVRSTAGAFGASERTVQRVFREAIGLGPKMFLRITRVQRAMRLSRASPAASWVAIADRCGFYDQAHLIREFNHFAKTTPSRFRGEIGAIAESLLT